VEEVKLKGLPGKRDLVFFPYLWDSGSISLRGGNLRSLGTIEGIYEHTVTIAVDERLKDAVPL